MPSPIAHIATGYLISRIARRSASRQEDRSNSLVLTVASISLSLLPDIDLVASVLFQDFRQFHNNITHSIFFGVAVALVIAVLALLLKRSDALRWFLIAFACYEVHLLMDFFCMGRGLMLAWPVTTQRYQSSVKLFYGFHWSEGIISVSHVWTLINEAVFVLCAALLCIILSKKKVKPVCNKTPP